MATVAGTRRPNRIPKICSARSKMYPAEAAVAQWVASSPTRVVGRMLPPPLSLRGVGDSNSGYDEDDGYSW